MQKKIHNSIEFIKHYAPLADKYGGFTVCFSGGKDSQVMLDLFKKADVNFHAIHNLTTNDPPDNIYFIRKYYPEVNIQLPDLIFFQLIEKKKMLPTINKRFCCSYFKESKEKGFVAVGVRREESYKRSLYYPIVYANRKCFDTNTYKGQKVIFRPIIDWLEWEIWQYIDDFKIPINPLYELQERVGCMICPFSHRKEVNYYLDKYPKLKSNLLRTIEKIMEKGYMRDFNTTPEEVLDWYLSKRNAKEFFTQLKLDL